MFGASDKEVSGEKFIKDLIKEVGAGVKAKFFTRINQTDTSNQSCTPNSPLEMVGLGLKGNH